MAKKKQIKNKENNINDLPIEAKALTNKQRAFCEHYVIDYNGKKAAEKAGYSEASSGPTASTLLKHKGCKKYITFLKIKAVKDLDITKQSILEVLASIAFVDHSTYYKDDGTAVPLHELTPSQRKALKDVKFKISPKKTEGIEREVSTYVFYSRTEAALKLANHLGMSLDKPSQTEKEDDSKQQADFESLMKNLSIDKLKGLTDALEEAQNTKTNVVQFEAKKHV